MTLQKFIDAVWGRPMRAPSTQNMSLELKPGRLGPRAKPTAIIGAHLQQIPDVRLLGLLEAARANEVSYASGERCLLGHTGEGERVNGDAYRHARKLPLATIAEASYLLLETRGNKLVPIVEAELKRRELARTQQLAALAGATGTIEKGGDGAHVDLEVASGSGRNG